MRKPERVKALFLFSLLCLVWGSSFILMKIGMFNSQGQEVFTPFQLAALRMASAGVVALPLFKTIVPIFKLRRRLVYIILCAMLGSFIPAFLFCVAETEVNSSVAGMLNATTPLFALIIGLIVFAQKVKGNQVAGIAVGLIGCILLALGKQGESLALNKFSLLIVLATICYGISVNIVKHKLGDVNALALTASIFLFLLPLSIGTLFVTGFFKLPLASAHYTNALVAGSTLGVVGTAIATVIFYRLVAVAGVIFSSMVTYGIPVVAIGWGLVYGERITPGQVGCLLVILAGVFLSSWHTLKHQITKKSPLQSHPQ